MKVRINGYEIEGTPEEVAQVIKLVDHQPLPPMTQPPTYPNPYSPQPFGPWPVTCDITKPGSGQMFLRDDVTIQAWN